MYLVSGIFSGKADSVILLGFECTISPQNWIKIVWAIFEKFEILFFFLMWTTLNFRSRGKTKKKTARDIYMRTLYIEFERDRSIGLGSTFGDGHTDKQTNRHGQTDRQARTHRQTGTHAQTRTHRHARTHAQTRTHAHAHAHTHTHTHTLFLKHIFRLWEWCRIKNHRKKNRSRILTRSDDWFRLYVRRRSHRQTDRQTDRRTDGQTDTHTHFF